MCTNTTAILSYAAFAAQPKIWKIGENIKLDRTVKT